MVSKPINFSQRDIIGCDDLRRTDEQIPESNVAIETIAGLGHSGESKLGVNFLTATIERLHLDGFNPSHSHFFLDTTYI